MNVWLTVMPGVYQPVSVLPATAAPRPRATRTRPAWFPRRIVRKPIRRYRICDARRLPY